MTAMMVRLVSTVAVGLLALDALGAGSVVGEDMTGGE